MAEGSQVPTYHNYINGQWVESVSGRTYTIANPADTKTVLGISRPPWWMMQTGQ